MCSRMKVHVESVPICFLSIDGWNPKSKLASVIPGGRPESLSDVFTLRSTRSFTSFSRRRSSTWCAVRLCATASESSAVSSSAAVKSPSSTIFSRVWSTSSRPVRATVTGFVAWSLPELSAAEVPGDERPGPGVEEPRQEPQRSQGDESADGGLRGRAARDHGRLLRWNHSPRAATRPGTHRLTQGVGPREKR